MQRCIRRSSKTGWRTQQCVPAPLRPISFSTCAGCAQAVRYFFHAVAASCRVVLSARRQHCSHYAPGRMWTIVSMHAGAWVGGGKRAHRSPGKGGRVGRLAVISWLVPLVRQCHGGRAVGVGVTQYFVLGIYREKIPRYYQVYRGMCFVIVLK